MSFLPCKVPSLHLTVLQVRAVCFGGKVYYNHTYITIYKYNHLICIPTLSELSNGTHFENFGTCWDQNCHLLGLLGTTTARQRGGFSWRVVSAFALQGTNIEDAGFAALIFKLLFWKDHFWRGFFFFWGGEMQDAGFFTGWLMVGCFFCLWQKQVIHVGWQVAELTLIYAGLSFLKTHWGGGNSNIGEDVQSDEYF